MITPSRLGTLPEQLMYWAGRASDRHLHKYGSQLFATLKAAAEELDKLQREAK